MQTRVRCYTEPPSSHPWHPSSTSSAERAPRPLPDLWYCSQTRPKSSRLISVRYDSSVEWPNSAQRSRTTACYSIDPSAFPSQNLPLQFLQVYLQRAKPQPPSLPDSSNRVIFYRPWHNVRIPRFDCMSLTTPNAWPPIYHMSLLLSSNSSLPWLWRQILGY